MSWKIDCVVVGPIQCNCYILSDPTSGDAWLIDPGAESDELLQYLMQKKMRLKGMLVTHAHIDHVGGIEMIARDFPAPVYYHAGDTPLYSNLKMQAQFFGVTPQHLQATQPTRGDATLQHEQSFEFGQGEIRVIHTPGHTPGSVCFHAMSDLSALFTGDTLFLQSIGRTELWGGSYEQILVSIHNQLMTLPENLAVFPGHG